MVWIIMLLFVAFAASAQVTFTNISSADAFVATGSSSNLLGSDLTGNNYGGAGSLVIAPSNSLKGEFQTVMRFDVSGATNLFNSTYGVNNWVISGVSLSFASNFGSNGAQPNNPIFPMVASGNFVIEWLSTDDWSEGTGNPSIPSMDGITYDSLPDLLTNLHEVLCTNTYVPPGDNIRVTWPLPLKSGFVSDIVTNGLVSLRFYAADTQVCYLFNSYNFGRTNQPMMRVTAVVAPSLKIISSSYATGGFHFNGLGAANVQYQIQASTNIVTTNWQSLGAATANGAGLLQFDDTDITNRPQRFYRFYR
ncbi:MAG TPA: hypothetical protein VH255_07305 [Verrucomicrobiae bacterium]|nr:hypothetical protein [Verrucomicrobiae bacterium]